MSSDIDFKKGTWLVYFLNVRILFIIVSKGPDI